MDSRLHSLRLNVIAVLCTLIVQYALGMYTNLFVTFPEPSVPVDHGAAWGFAWSQPTLAAHIVIAFLLLAGAIAFVVRVYRARERRLYWPAWLGLIAIFAAGFSGATFVPYQLDLYSYTMSLFFLLAAASYGWAYLRSRDAH